MDWQNLLNQNRIRQTTRKQNSNDRNEFESDFGRIIFSPAIRRMHDKTQVFPLTTDDNIHSRLTHSLEVMSVGYSLGVTLCEKEIFCIRTNMTKYDLFRRIPIILKNCCLIHDIGNPPFGHFGETVIQDYFKELFKDADNRSQGYVVANKKNRISLTSDQKNDFLEFDGNAQGLRVLTKLQILNDAYGLNLTYATLASYIKYPNFDKSVKTGPIAIHKRGVYSTEIDYFKRIIDECDLKVNGLYIRHPLCYLMESADSICYLTMDIEDGFNKKIFDIEYLYSKLKDIDLISKRIEEIYFDKNKIYSNDTTKIVNFRIEIISKLVDLAVKNFIDNIKLIEEGVFNDELISEKNCKLVECLKEICQKKIFKSRDIVSLEITGHSVITGLLNYYIDFVFHDDKKYCKKAADLISSSIIRTAIEENRFKVCKRRLEQWRIKDPSQLTLPEKTKLKGDIDSLEKMIENFERLQEVILDLKKNAEKNSEKIEVFNNDFSKLIFELDELVKPELDDLEDYYKLRVIVDFVSGMTDQYALAHFQKISGQKIS